MKAGRIIGCAVFPLPAHICCFCARTLSPCLDRDISFAVRIPLLRKPQRRSAVACCSVQKSTSWSGPM